jgi:hypothetical protein
MLQLNIFPNGIQLEDHRVIMTKDTQKRSNFLIF